MDILTYNKKYRKIITLTALSGFILFVLHLIIGRIHVSLMSDVLFQNGFLVRFLPFLQTLLTVCSFALFYGVSAYCYSYYGIKKKLFVIITVVLLTLFKYASSLIASLLIDRMDAEVFMLLKLPTTLLSFALEAVQYAAVFVIIWLANRNTPSDKQVLGRPFLFISLTVMLINVASRIVYDIGYGAPTSSAEVFRMIVAYASDILLYGVVLYLLMFLVIKVIRSHIEK